eukprot:CAMPEP_0198145280 /NCGR_PEP_ID=MMETSP1443-20131203/22477_1 /TAXON_ID=186043 /ORGANISM="Entomoneis sp., Strain CCMP2396" /LENGTH=320 /DNA_ID=CAMNT_0043808875 /DNA_START=52 /DNA_END=1014 /DNA_ORIENTATION=+
MDQFKVKYGLEDRPIENLKNDNVCDCGWDGCQKFQEIFRIRYNSGEEEPRAGKCFHIGLRREMVSHSSSKAEGGNSFSDIVFNSIQCKPETREKLIKQRSGCIKLARHHFTPAQLAYFTKNKLFTPIQGMDVTTEESQASTFSENEKLLVPNVSIEEVRLLTLRFVVKCHCGRVKGRFSCNVDIIAALDCDCSDCWMRRNVHIIVPERDFCLDLLASGNAKEEQSALFEDATTLYEWGTKTAQRRFCKTCGVLPWYRARSNPEGYAITINCVDWSMGGTLLKGSPPNIIIHKFDGVHWEESMKAVKEGTHPAVKISDQSK